jgi:hypothetical protein
MSKNITKYTANFMDGTQNKVINEGNEVIFEEGFSGDGKTYIITYKKTNKRIAEFDTRTGEQVYPHVNNNRRTD